MLRFWFGLLDPKLFTVYGIHICIYNELLPVYLAVNAVQLVFIDKQEMFVKHYAP